jgi:hypothetical protein
VRIYKWGDQTAEKIEQFINEDQNAQFFGRVLAGLEEILTRSSNVNTVDTWKCIVILVHTGLFKILQISVPLTKN